jgi:hypothetical protein
MRQPLLVVAQARSDEVFHRDGPLEADENLSHSRFDYRWVAEKDHTRNCAQRKFATEMVPLTIEAIRKLGLRGFLLLVYIPPHPRVPATKCRAPIVVKGLRRHLEQQMRTGLRLSQWRTARSWHRKLTKIDCRVQPA